MPLFRACIILTFLRVSVDGDHQPDFGTCIGHSSSSELSDCGSLWVCKIPEWVSINVKQFICTVRIIVILTLCGVYYSPVYPQIPGWRGAVCAGPWWGGWRWRCAADSLQTAAGFLLRQLPRHPASDGNEAARSAARGNQQQKRIPRPALHLGHCKSKRLILLHCICQTLPVWIPTYFLDKLWLT